MEFFRGTLDILKKPFPDDMSISYFVKILVVLSLFITFFLYVFEPFGLSTLESNRFLICLGFGSMTFVGAAVYELTAGQLIRLAGLYKNWTFGKWILNTLATMLFISMANFIFARLLFFGFIEWNLFPTMIYSTFMIGVIPIVTLGGFLLSKQEKKYQTIAEEINRSHTSSTALDAVDNTTIFDIPTHQIKYIEALQNYVKIGYINKEGDLKIQTERMTLKEIVKTTEGSAITKCHRSYLVNKEAIISASGNAQGLLLTLSGCDKLIPVSRACVPMFRDQ